MRLPTQVHHTGSFSAKPSGCPSTLLAAFACATIVGLCMLDDRFHHWFVLPILACGILIGADLADWLRGKVDIFDPVALIGAVGTHFFFLSPLLHVLWDYEMRYVVPPPDWRPWLGGMAFLNAIGLFLYRATRKRPGRLFPPRTVAVWKPDWSSAPILLGSVLCICLAAQLYVYWSFGGLTGYIEAYERREGDFTGLGWLFMISEAFPIVLFISFALYMNYRRVRPSWWVLLAALTSVASMSIVFGGLRGSRSLIIWTLFWATGIVHFWLRRLPRWFPFAAAGALIVFMYFYGFYKASGRDAVVVVAAPETRTDVVERTGRSLERLVLGDLSRADIQAFLLYRMIESSEGYKYASGRTYLGAVALLVPRALWPARPETKVKEGTEAQYGAGSYDRMRWRSSRVYGLTGEGMLNFGPVAVPIGFVLLGYAVRSVADWLSRFKASADVRLLAMPFVLNVLVIFLVGDSDNVVFYVVKGGAVPCWVLWLVSRGSARFAKLRDNRALDASSGPMHSGTVSRALRCGRCIEQVRVRCRSC